MKKNVASTESSPIQNHVEASEEQIREYQKLKARNEWIQMNKKYLDQIQRKQLLYHKLIFIVVCFNFINSLLLWLKVMFL